MTRVIKIVCYLRAHDGKTISHLELTRDPLAHNLISELLDVWRVACERARSYRGTAELRIHSLDRARVLVLFYPSPDQAHVLRALQTTLRELLN